MIYLNHKFHKYYYLYDFKWMYLRLPAYVSPWVGRLSSGPHLHPLPPRHRAHVYPFGPASRVGTAVLSRPFAERAAHLLRVSILDPVNGGLGTTRPTQDISIPLHLGRDGCPQPSVRRESCAPRKRFYPFSGQRRVGDNPPYPRHLHPPASRVGTAVLSRPFAERGSYLVRVSILDLVLCL